MLHHNNEQDKSTRDTVSNTERRRSADPNCSESKKRAGFIVYDCGKELLRANVRDCNGCPFYTGPIDRSPIGTRGGETPAQSYAWRKLVSRHGLAGSGSDS